jgi:hypothetical protein
MNKQLYFIAIEKLLKVGFHERYIDGIPETKLWMEAVAEWLTQFQKMRSSSNSTEHQFERVKRKVITELLAEFKEILPQEIAVQIQSSKDQKEKQP